jgi:hypothetical protein
MASQVDPELLYWHVTRPGGTIWSIYISLKLPVRDAGLRNAPFINDRTHITLTYGVSVDSWRSFWAMKTNLQLLLVRRQVGLLFGQAGAGHTFPLNPDSELWYLCDRLRGALLQEPGIREIAPHRPDPYHIAWLPL